MRPSVQTSSNRPRRPSFTLSNLYTNIAPAPNNQQGITVNNSNNSI